MKIFLNIEADNPLDLAAALQSLGSMAQKALFVPFVSPAGEAGGSATPGQSEPTSPAVEEPKKTRGRPKGDAKASAPESAPPAVVEAKPDVKPVTFDEVKASIIDLLNDWTMAMPKDVGPEATTVVDGRTIKVAEIRTTILSEMLPKLGASGKISTIPEESFAKVQGLIDESREKLAEYAAQREVEE